MKKPKTNNNKKLNKFKTTRNHTLSALKSNGIKLEVNNRNIPRKSPNTWGLSKTIQSNTEVKKEISKEKICFELNDSENATYQNLWDAVKAVFTGKFITLNVYIKKIRKI